MSAYNFQAQFAPLVESGLKRQTIRAIGKRRHARPGEPVQLYTGMRTKACRKLLIPDPICTDVLPISMRVIEAHGISARMVRVTIKDHDLTVTEKKQLARRDGFSSVAEMTDWFERVHGMPFEGLLIKWEPAA